MTCLKSYSAYKHPDIEWLGDVPRHWDCLPNRALFAEIIDKNHPDEQMLSVTIARGVVTQSDLLEDSSKKDSSNLDKASYKLVRPGDLAYNKMRAWQGAVGVSDFRGIVSPAYIIMRPRAGQEPRYLHYLFRTPAFATEAERWSYGITSDQWSLRAEDFKQIYSLNPPLDEQRAIADFLDVIDARISRFIAAKRRMIALLEEKKQAVINQAVTRGLDPDVPLKDSGVDWLGEIPAHWELAEIGRYWRVTDCKHVTVPFVNESEDTYPLASVVHAQRFELDLKNAKHTTGEWYRYLIDGGRQPRVGDLVFCRNVSVGSAALVTTESPFAMGQDVCLLSTQTQDSRFLNYGFRSGPARHWIDRTLVGSTFRRINVAQIRSIRVPRSSPPGH